MPEPSSTPESAAREEISRAADSASLPPDPHRLPPPGDWFARDAERHLLDQPKFCPMCAASIHDHGGISTEYWMSAERHFMTWCGACGWFGEVVRFEMVVISEVDH